MESLILRKRTIWPVRLMTPFNAKLSREIGFGKHLLFQKSGASYGNAFIEAFLLERFLMQEV